MNCPECGLEMMIYRATVNGQGGVDRELVCRNPRCSQFDRRLARRAEEAAAEPAETPNTAAE